MKTHSTKYGIYILSAFVILMAGANRSFGYRQDPKYSIKWIDYDSTGVFSAEFYDESGQSAEVRRKPQLFISPKEVPYDKKDLSSVSYNDITIADKSKDTMGGIYKPAAECQTYPFIDKSAFNQFIAYDSCYFIICPAPAILSGYDNELHKNCTKSAKFKWYDYLQTLVNYADNQASFFYIEIKDGTTMEPIEKSEIKIKPVDTSTEKFLDTICNYLNMQLSENIRNRGFLEKLKEYYLKKTVLDKKVKVRDSTRIWLPCVLDESMNSVATDYNMKIDAHGFKGCTVALKVNPNIEKVIVILEKNVVPRVEIIEKRSN
nr:hypothetical protein [candidate division Zixibacteria bacterium]